jgi:hypothetical protein
LASKLAARVQSLDDTSRVQSLDDIDVIPDTPSSDKVKKKKTAQV